MTIIFQKRIYREDLKANPQITYVFGDNEMRVGLGGQAAEMRGEANAHGVATLRATGQFWSDNDHARQCAILDHDFSKLFDLAKDKFYIVLPSDGIGTGLAHLGQRAPKTFQYLQTLWNDLIFTGKSK